MQISQTDPYCEKALQAIVNNKAPASGGFPSSQPNKYIQQPKDVNMFGYEESFSKWINIFYNIHIFIEPLSAAFPGTHKSPEL